MTKPTESFYATPERADSAKLQADASMMAAQSHIAVLLNAIPQVAMILNAQRQAVYVNDNLVRILGAQRWQDLVGGRPGELLNCKHCRDMAAGCGTSEACHECGAVQAIVESQQTHQSVAKECRMTVMQGHLEQAMDLRVDAVPMVVNDEEFTVVTATDISDQKRRSILERVFFHDLINVAGGLNGYVRYLLEADDASVMKDGLADTLRMSEDLLEQIAVQRELRAAEGGDLVVTGQHIFSRQLLDNAVTQMSHHAVAIARSVRVDPGSEDIAFTSDPRVLRRVLINMLKNAIEASPRGTEVMAGCRKESGMVRFWVRNPGVIPREIQLQIFQRSFSTKGTSRGLGSYSMKLLSERYLHGSVGFVSNDKDQTVFHVMLPMELPPTLLATASQE